MLHRLGDLAGGGGLLLHRGGNTGLRYVDAWPPTCGDVECDSRALGVDIFDVITQRSPPKNSGR